MLESNCYTSMKWICGGFPSGGYIQLLTTSFCCSWEMWFEKVFPQLFFLFLLAAWELCKAEFLISRLQKPCYDSASNMAKIVQLYHLYFILFLNYRAILDTSVERSEAHMLKRCIKNCSIVKLYNKALIITNGEM